MLRLEKVEQFQMVPETDPDQETCQPRPITTIESLPLVNHSLKYKVTVFILIYFSF